jgi:hypothetical protein
LCETHGNVVIPKLPQFESKSLQDRLAAILSSETQETEEPEEAEEPVPAPPSPEPKSKKPRKPKAKAQASPEPEAEPEAASAVAKPKPKKAKKAKSPEPVAPPPPPPPPKPEAVKVPKTASIEERMALILSEEPEEEDLEEELEDDLDEPESPGAVRHRLIMAEKGLAVEYDEEDPEEDELNAGENDDGFLTEEEFDE